MIGMQPFCRFVNEDIRFMEKSFLSNFAHGRIIELYVGILYERELHFCIIFIFVYFVFFQNRYNPPKAVRELFKS